MGNMLDCLAPKADEEPRNNQAAARDVARQDGKTSSGSDKRTNQYAHLGPEDEPLNSVVAAGENICVFAGEDNVVRVFDWAEGRVVREWKAHSKAVNRVAVGKASGLVFSGSRDGNIIIWKDSASGPLGTGGWGKDTSSGGPAHTLKGHELTVNGLDVGGEDENVLFSGSRDWTVRIWDVETGKETALGKVHRNVVTFARAIPDSTSFLQASEDLQLRVWDSRAMSSPAQIIASAHVNVMTCCDVSSDGNLFLSSSNGFNNSGSELKLWDRRMGKLLLEPKGHSESITCCAFLPHRAVQGGGSDHNTAVSGSQDASVRLWRLPESAEEAEGYGGKELQICSESVNRQHRFSTLSVASSGATGGGVSVFSGSASGALGWWKVDAKGSLRLQAFAAAEEMQ